MYHRRTPRTDLPTNQLSARQLAAGLGAGSDVAAAAIASLCRAASDAADGPARRALDRWKAQVATTCGRRPEEPAAAIDRLAACYRLGPGDVPPGEVLFSVHTYYALLVRLVVWHWTASFDNRPRPAEQFDAARSPAQFKACVEMFELGTPGGPSTMPAVFRGDLFAWFTSAWSEPLAAAIRQAARAIADWRPDTSGQAAPQSDDLLTDLYQAVFPRRVRHGLGEYYTPDWLAEHVLDEVGHQGDAGARLLDPACGSGRFLAAAIRRVRRAAADSESRRPLFARDLCRRILDSVVGYDLHPLAVLSARANYLIALGDLARYVGDAEIPVYNCDSILRPPHDEAELPSGLFDFVVGNPPWIAWDHLPPDYRRATHALWQQYGLFSLSGSEARHGGGKKDLSMLMLYRTADRDLKDGGRLGMVVTQTLFQTKGAGDGFRRFRLGADGPPLGVLGVNDLVGVRPFDAANWTSTIVLEKGTPTAYPVPYVKWTPSSDGSAPAGRAPDAHRRRYRAEPIDPQRPSSPWFLRPPGLDTPLERLTGRCDYEAHLGANSGGANGVYWVELLGPAEGGVLVRNVATRGKRRAASVRQAVEADLLHPLLRWTDVKRYRAVPSLHLLLVQDVDTRQGIDEATMQSRYAKTLAYLGRFRKLLSGRAAYRRYQHRAPFYSMYNVGPYTAAPIKVVWRRMDRRINAAVVRSIETPLLGIRPVVPQETCVLIAADTADEAHYLCALLNSAIVDFLVRSHSVRGGKGFGTPSMLDYLRLKRFDPGNAAHAALASAGRRAHRAAAEGEDLGEIQERIDRLAASLWGLGETERESIRREIEADP